MNHLLCRRARYRGCLYILVLAYELPYHHPLLARKARRSLPATRVLTWLFGSSAAASYICHKLRMKSSLSNMLKGKHCNPVYNPSSRILITIDNHYSRSQTSFQKLSVVSYFMIELIDERLDLEREVVDRLGVEGRHQSKRAHAELHAFIFSSFPSQ